MKIVQISFNNVLQLVDHHSTFSTLLIPLVCILCLLFDELADDRRYIEFFNTVTSKIQVVYLFECKSKAQRLLDGIVYHITTGDHDNRDGIYAEDWCTTKGKKNIKFK